jgi:cell volume regulation protein A
MPAIETILLVAASLLLLSVVASKTSGPLGVPALLIFLLIGMLAGSDGPGGIAFDDPWAAQSLGVLALALILFAGGIDTAWSSVRPVLLEGIALATAGVLITAGVLAALVHLALGYSLLEGMLLSAIVSSTDAAAVFAVLRSKKVGLKGRLKPLLELESGSNDPMAVFLTVAVIGMLSASASSVGGVAVGFVVQMTIGGVAGYLMGRGTVLLVNRLRLEYQGLYPVLTLSLVLLTYAASASVGGNGFLAVYVAGLVVGNSDFIHKRSLIRFHDGLAWLMQIVMFLALGLLVFPSRLLAVAGNGLVTAAFLMLIARPVSVLLILWPSAMTVREKVMVAWVGLRGAVPIVLATFPLLAGVPLADELFHLVFFVVLASVAIQGTSIPLVARWLRVDVPIAAPERELEDALGGSPRGRLEEIRVGPRSPAVGRRILELGFPSGALIVLLKRGDEAMIPDGGTALHEGDRLVVLADEEVLPRLRAMVGGRESGDGSAPSSA